MMRTSSFTFHGLVNFHLHSEAAYSHKFFNGEYGWGSGSGGAPASIHLHWKHAPAPILQHDQGTFHVHKLAARWRYQIQVDQEAVTIKASGNRIALTMVHHMLVHPSLRYLASQQGLILLHGAALVRDKSSFIFTGVGGTGKTTTTSLLLDKGEVDWRLHADDYVFLNEQGETFSYLTRAHLYQELLQWVPSIKERLTAMERAKAWLFNLVLSASGKTIRWAVRLPLTTLWPNKATAQRAQLAGLLMLERSNSKSVEIQTVADRASLIDELIHMNMFEARHFIHLLKNSVGENRASSLIEEWQRRERSILHSALANSFSYRLSLPRFATSDSNAASLIEAEIMALDREPTA